MVRKGIVLLMCSFFLLGSTILPLGDFSLIRDIPAMYANYTKVADPAEIDPIDFIGDYLLQGKEIFGNNPKDKTPANNNSLQFQHQANALNIVFLQTPITLFIAPESEIAHPLFRANFRTSDFRDELFRPPLG